MSRTTNISAVILLEEEIRIAAGLLAKYREIQETASLVEKNELLVSVFRACEAALYGAENEEACIMLSRVPRPEPKARRKK